MRLLSFSESESRRFAFRVFRGGRLGPADLPSFFAEAARERADVVILRMEAEAAAALLPALYPHCHAIHADSLIEFKKNLSRETQSDFLGSGSEIACLAQDDGDMLTGLIERCYSEYTNHYHANPCLDPALVLPGLVEFSRAFTGRADRTLLVGTWQGKAAGYLCMEIKDGTGSSVIGGSALDLPRALRHRLLCDMTHRGDAWLIERGVKRFRAVTRTDKIYIQKLLVKNMHCLPAASLVTIHINLFFAQMSGKIQGAPLPRYNSGFVLRPGISPLKHESFSLRRGDAEYRYTAASDQNGICSFACAVTDHRVPQIFP